MKKRILIALLATAMVAGYAAMPRMVESTIPTAYYITPNFQTYENVISCTGTILSEEVRQICLQSPLVAEEVYVSVGDTVREGDPLLRVDAEKTSGMGLSLSLIQDISDDIDTQGATGIDWAALASSYGLNAATSSGMDAGALEGLLADSGLITSADSGTMVTDDTVEGEILSPIAGVITSVDIQSEIPVGVGKAIVTIADNERYKALVSVREEDISRVQVGDAAKVRGVGFSGLMYTGAVIKIYPTARKSFTGTSSETVVDVEIALDAPDKRLKPGFSAKVEIVGGSGYSLITVPYEAIRQDENNNEYVYLYENGKLVKQVVVTGQELTNEVEILDGVSYNSVVVMNPSVEIKEGSMVHIQGRADVD